MNKLDERAGDGTWLGDLGELTTSLKDIKLSTPWVKWSVIFLSFAAVIVTAGLIISNVLNTGSAPLPAPSESSSVTPSPAPTASATLTPTEQPPVPLLKDALLSTVPGAWTPSNLSNCKESWATSTEDISSVLVLSKAPEAFKAAGFTSVSSWSEDSLTITGTGNQEGITSGELVFTVDSMTLCLR